MALVHFNELSEDQRRQVREVYPHLSESEYPRFNFWVRKDGQMSRAKGSHQLTEEAYEAALAEVKGENIRTKGDLRDWKPGTTFHFGRD